MNHLFDTDFAYEAGGFAERLNALKGNTQAVLNLIPDAAPPSRDLPNFPLAKDSAVGLCQQEVLVQPNSG
jgi:hypothetical protein